LGHQPHSGGHALARDYHCEQPLSREFLKAAKFAKCRQRCFTDQPLDDRVAAAFEDGATPDTVAALIQETESAGRAAGERQQATVSRLRERLTELQGAEEDERRRTAYEEARAERDALAEELARVYPPLAAQLADLLGRVRANDERIEHINAHAPPRSCGPLLVAELVARGLDGFVQNSVNVPRIVRRVQLPAFEYDAHHPYVWPRSSSVDAGSLMFRAISELGSRSA
jgi:hypothetical protein